jgi:hypothetical protein
MSAMCCCVSDVVAVDCPLTGWVVVVWASRGAQKRVAKREAHVMQRVRPARRLELKDG